MSELLEKIVRVYSPSFKEKAVAEVLLKEMNLRGFNAEIDEAGNVIGVKGKGQPVILFEAHMDTVKPELLVKKENNFLFGRGAVDAKGTLCAMIEAAEKTDASNGTVIVAGTVEEECPTSKGAHFLAESFNPDYCIVGEPSSWNAVTVGYKGILTFSFSLETEKKHSSLGENAADFLADFLFSLRKSFEGQGKGFGELYIELKELNATEEKASARISLRTPLGFDFSSAKKIISEKAGKAEIEFLQELEAVKVQKNNLLVRSFIKAIRKENGKPKFKVKTGTSNMNILAKAWNCPVVTYGPGDSSLDHTSGEKISLKEYEQSITVLKNVLGEILEEH